MDWREHIISDSNVLGGKPVVRDTRVPVDLILAYLSDGGSFADIMDGYPSLSEADIRAAIAFSNHMMSKESESARREAA